MAMVGPSSGKCRRNKIENCHIISQQSLIEFKLALHNAVARKRYLTIQRATFTVDIDGFQTD